MPLLARLRAAAAALLPLLQAPQLLPLQRSPGASSRLGKCTLLRRSRRGRPGPGSSRLGKCTSLRRSRQGAALARVARATLRARGVTQKSSSSLTQSTLWAGSSPALQRSAALGLSLQPARLAPAPAPRAFL